MAAKHFFGKIIQAFRFSTFYETRKYHEFQKKTHCIPLNRLMLSNRRIQIWIFHKSTKSTYLGMSMMNDRQIGFTKFTILNEPPPDGHIWARGRKCPQTFNETQSSCGKDQPQAARCTLIERNLLLCSDDDN